MVDVLRPVQLHLDTFCPSKNNYPGGKNGEGTYQAIINQIPPADQYIEGFLGSGAIVRNIRPFATSFGIDINPKVTAAWSNIAIPGLTVINGNALSILPTLDYSISTFIYLDPPYPLSTRAAKSIYDYEMTDEDHIALLVYASSVPAAIAISSYDNAVYNNILHDWRKVYYNNTTRNGSRIECLYCNYQDPIALHDYGFLGANYTDRQRIKRKVNRHVQRLLSLPILERAAIVNSINNIL